MGDVITKARALIEPLKAIKVCVVRANRDILGVRPINAAQEAIKSAADLLAALAHHADALTAERDALKRRVAAVVAAYDRAMPMRQADWHGEDCDCLRCEVDRARAALQSEGA